MIPTGHGAGHGAAELEDAFAAHFAEVDRICATGDWAAYAEEFTPDAVYFEHAFGEMRGRDEIRAWAVKTMGAFPGNVMTAFPLAWKVLDPPTSRIICEVRNLMPDPGDGSILEEPNITILTYAGDGLWSRQEDIYNPLRFHTLSKRWARIAAEHGNLPDDAAAYV